MHIRSKKCDLVGIFAVRFLHDGTMQAEIDCRLAEFGETARWHYFNDCLVNT